MICLFEFYESFSILAHALRYRFFFFCIIIRAVLYFFIIFFSPLCLSCSRFLPLSGWIVSLAALNQNVGVGVIMMINAVFFTGQAAMGVVMLKRVNMCTYMNMYLTLVIVTHDFNLGCLIEFQNK